MHLLSIERIKVMQVNIYIHISFITKSVKILKINLRKHEIDLYFKAHTIKKYIH